MYYMSVLMKQIGFDRFQSTYMSLVGGGSLLLGTLPAIFLMETCGRRFWAIAMLPGFFVGLVLVGVSYHVGGGLRGREGTYLAGLIVYELFFGSYACLTWVIPVPTPSFSPPKSTCPSIFHPHSPLNSRNLLL